RWRSLGEALRWGKRRRRRLREWNNINGLRDEGAVREAHAIRHSPPRDHWCPSDPSGGIAAASPSEALP
ncbi:MAG TPA: hypothetical protein VF118_11320, partial [Gemmatimonadaceae bacterium]